MNESSNRPSVLFRPRLRRLYVDTSVLADRSREWEAFYGDPKEFYSGVRAYGATPEEAMLAFDLAFNTGNETTYNWDIRIKNAKDNF